MRSAIAAHLIAATIALLPIYKRISTVDLNRTSKDNLFLIIAIGISALLGDKKRDMPLSGFFLASIALFLSVANQFNPAAMLVMLQSFYIAAGLCLFIKMYECFDLKHTGLILNGMCIGALIQFVFVLFNSFGINLDLHLMYLFNSNLVVQGLEPGLIEAVGTLGNTNLLAGYLCVCMIAFLRPKWVWLLPLPLFALIFSRSLMGIGAFFAGCGFYFARKYIDEWKIYAVAIVPMFLAYFTGLNDMENGRFKIWGELFSVYDFPNVLWGYGPGWFSTLGITFNGAVALQEHSLYLSIVSVFGIIGLIAFLKIGLLAIKGSKNKPIFSTALFVLFINGYGHLSLHQSTMVIIIISVLVICLIKEDENEFNVEWSSASK